MPIPCFILSCIQELAGLIAVGDVTEVVPLDTFRALHEHDHQLAQTKSAARGRALCCVECDA